MTAKHTMTPEEEALGRLLDKKETLSEAGRTVLEEAGDAAYREYLVHNICFQPAEYEEAMDKMRLATPKLTDQDREILMELVRRAIAAAASIDPFDGDTLVGFRVYRSDLYKYYLMVSNMVRYILNAQLARERIAEQEPVDDSAIPF